MQLLIRVKKTNESDEVGSLYYRREFYSNEDDGIVLIKDDHISADTYPELTKYFLDNGIIKEEDNSYNIKYLLFESDPVPKRYNRDPLIGIMCLHGEMGEWVRHIRDAINRIPDIQLMQHHLNTIQANYNRSLSEIDQKIDEIIISRMDEYIEYKEKRDSVPPL